MHRVLIVEDEKGLRITLEDRLIQEGYQVVTAEDGIEGEDLALKERFDIILLDVMLPRRDGFGVCQNLREKGIDTPILMLTARGTSMDTVMGLRLGADDYLIKPFEMSVLLARMAALIRRSSKTPGTSDQINYQFGEFFLDRNRKELLRNNDLVPLNAQEYRLLLYFVEHPNRILSRNDLLDGVWGYESETTTRTVDVHVGWLRQKLGERDRPVHLLTLRGQGYKFLP